MASLYTLPAPLPLHILLQLHDLKALDAARRSCSLFAAVFAKHAVELLENLMVATLAECVTFRIRQCILLRQDGGGAKTMSADELGAILTQRKRPLPRTLHFEAISCTLRDFSYLASVCDTILQRKLQHLQELPHHHLGHAVFHSFLPMKSEEYNLRVLSAPTWVEQQRVLTALWALYARHLRNVGDKKRPSPVTQVNKCIEDSFEEIEESFATVISYESPEYDYNKPSSWTALASPPIPAAECDSRDILWGNTREEGERTVGTTSTSYMYFHHRQHSVVKLTASWSVLRKLGLAIWDYRRMADELELWPRPSGSGSRYIMSPDNVIFTWNSLCQGALKLEATGAGY